MGYNARNDEIRDNITRMRQEWEAQRGGAASNGFVSPNSISIYLASVNNKAAA
jgi:hypothetical protein